MVGIGKLLGSQELAELRRRWEKDIGIAAKDVIRLLDHAEAVLEIAKGREAELLEEIRMKERG
jgi:hypothetical protein